jgi:hypothetical protein
MCSIRLGRIERLSARTHLIGDEVQHGRCRERMALTPALSREREREKTPSPPESGERAGVRGRAPPLLLNMVANQANSCLGSHLQTLTSCPICGRISGGLAGGTVLWC